MAKEETKKAEKGKEKSENKIENNKTEDKLTKELSPKSRKWLKGLDESSEEQKPVVQKPAVERPFDPYKIIRFPLSTEKSIRQIEFDNKLTFVVSKKATKLEIKQAVEELFKVRVLKVNTQNSFKGQKRAYLKLHPESLASDVSADLGLI